MDYDWSISMSVIRENIMREILAYRTRKPTTNIYIHVFDISNMLSSGANREKHCRKNVLCPLRHSLRLVGTYLSAYTLVKVTKL